MPRPPVVCRLTQILKTRAFAREDLNIARKQLEDRLLSTSPNFTHEGNFQRITANDLRLAFQHIDSIYFNDLCALSCNAEHHELSFRLGKRMTSCGGKTTTQILAQGRKSFEIAISPRLIHDTFDNQTTAIVTGVPCHTPLQAMLRIMEHEVLHMLEMLIWSNSSCSQTRFKRMANQLFGHSESTHRLLTPREVAASIHKIAVGNRVQFTHNSHSYAGIVNHINRRATVLVPDSQGITYNDGGRYRKFYVPLNQLKKAN